MSGEPENAGDPGLLWLGSAGALESYSSSPFEITSISSSGAIGADGAIDLSKFDTAPGEKAKIDLTDLFEQLNLAGLTDPVLDEASIELGALGSYAQKDGAAVATSYGIADLNLDLHSQALDGVTQLVDTTVGEVNNGLGALVGPGGDLTTTVQNLVGTLDDLSVLGLVNVDASLDELGIDTSSLLTTVQTQLLQAPINNATTPTGPASVNIDLSTGTISVNVAELLVGPGGPYAGQSLSSLPANTDLLTDSVVDAIVSGVTSALTGSGPNALTTKVVSIVKNGVYGLSVDLKLSLGVTLANQGLTSTTISLADADGNAATVGGLLAQPGYPAASLEIADTGILGGLLSPVLALLTPALGTITGLVGGVVTPILDGLTPALSDLLEPLTSNLLGGQNPLLKQILDGVVNLTANVQPTEGDLGAGSTTVRALGVEVLPVLGAAAVNLELGSATVKSATTGSPNNGADSNASASAAASATANGSNDAAAQGAAKAAAYGDQSSTADATASANAVAASKTAANANANAGASNDASATATTSANSAAQAAATGSQDASATSAQNASGSVKGDSNSGASSKAAAQTDASTNASSSAAANGSNATSSTSTNTNTNTNTNASTSANASANPSASANTNGANSSASTKADANVNASASASADSKANAAAKAAALANANTTASAKATANAQAAAKASAKTSASTNASTKADAASKAAAQAAALAKSDTDSNAKASAKANSNASAAAKAAAIANASSDASGNNPNPNTLKCLTPSPKTPFLDTPTNHKFYTEIDWMYCMKYTTGIRTDAGLIYGPQMRLSREAMAAFIYRMEADPNWKLPKQSPFADMKPGDKFYKEIVWMHDQGLSTGIKQAEGKPIYGPKLRLSREAMAAFIYRLEAPAGYHAPAKSKMADMKRGDKFYTEINWMVEEDLSTGIRVENGNREFWPKSRLSREAMAAFIYRLVNDYRA